ncbi:McrC family protein [Mucilaginibacter lutimaris]|uniref:McrC family protein n=1 Tax=Mucilaginibacter lutimaris TaxID=931629 RepID=A0ABW2ZKM4_9SPHI
MNPQPKTITVYEHQAIKISDKYSDSLTSDQLITLQKFHETTQPSYYSLVHNGIKFCGFVGVLQVGNLTIEVLPKIDRVAENDKYSWRKVLLGMLKRVGPFDVLAISATDLKLTPNNILEVYIEIFLLQVEHLLHQGLLKRYRKTEINATALKGKIVFGQHLKKNIIHKEHFFIRYTTYDKENLFNRIIYKTLKHIQNLNLKGNLHSKTRHLLLDFPEMPDVVVSESLYSNIIFDRKSESYREALLISKLLLLNYHPDINRGRNHVLALMFDMDLLWEKFVYSSIKRHLKEFKAEKQISKPYWKLEGKRTIGLQPDIVLIQGGSRFILDTKWKLPQNTKPNHSDLQQMYAYTKYFTSSHTVLCYPGAENNFIKGKFYNENSKNEVGYPCSVMRIKFDPKKSIDFWQKLICLQLRINFGNESNT